MASVPMPRRLVWEDDTDAARDYRAQNEAFFEGLQTGRLGLSLNLNKYAEGIGRAEWLRGWRQGQNERAADAVARNEKVRRIAAEMRARARRCRYTDRACDCDGRGLCMDAV